MGSVALALSLAGLIALSAFFSASETALFSLAPLRLRDLARGGTPPERLVARLMERPRKVLVTVLFGNMIANILASALASAAILRVTDNPGLGILLTTLIMTFVILVFGEIAPKTLAYRHAEPVARMVAGPLLAMGKIVSPVRRLLLALTDAVLGAERRADEHVDLAEAEAMLRMAHAEGEVETHERDLVLGVFELGSSPVGDVMTPRTEIFSVPASARVSDVLERVRAAGFSKVPLAGNGPDEMAGFVTATDLLRASEDATVAGLAREASWVPEVKPAIALLEEFRDTGARLAFVVDEHGHLSGVVTLTDLLEEISGEMIERGDLPKVVYERVARNRVVVPGRMEIRFFNEQFGTDLASEDAETLAGLVLERSGRIPATGESLVLDGLAVRIARAEPHRILSLEVELPESKRSIDDGGLS
jgi:CBS domain containing-hemolysin-like protein